MSCDMTVEKNQYVHKGNLIAYRKSSGVAMATN